VADKGGSSKGIAASARTSLCGSREGGVSGEDLEVGAATTEIHEDSAVEKLPAAVATQRASGRQKERAYVKETPQKRKQNLAEALDEVEGDGDEEDEAEVDETTPSRVKKESKQKSPRVFRKAGEENEFMRQFPATLGCSGLRLGVATSVSAIVIFGPYQKEDKLDGPAHVRILKSAVLNSLSEDHKTKFAELEATQNEALLTACALQRVETMRVCGLNVIPKLKLFLNKHFFGETPGSRFKGTSDTS
jgi:hypothetical protein